MLAMLATLMAVLAVSVSEGFQWLSTPPIDAGPVDSPVYKPEDPSTLTLAMIGLGTLVVYFATRRSNSSRRLTLSGEARPIKKPFDDATDSQATGPDERPSRGAA
jgi:hypothetical protein